MITIDTNIIVRFLTKDNEEQYKASYSLFEKANIFVPDTVILESEWVLRYAYEFKPKEICTAFKKIFGLRNVTLSNAQMIAQVLQWHEGGIDFADAFHLGLSQNYKSLKTFDEKFIKKARSLTKCLVDKP